jgi:hypothetical protein
MTFSKTLNIRKRTLECAWQYFGTQSSFCIKVKLKIQWLNEKNWIKSMCIQYIMYIFSMATGLHVCGAWHITKPNKKEKKIQCPPIKSSPF